MFFLFLFLPLFFIFFFFNDTATTEIYTLSYTTLFRSDKEPIGAADEQADGGAERQCADHPEDRKSTRLNSSHPSISYAVFCLKKKKKQKKQTKQKHKQKISL